MNPFVRFSCVIALAWPVVGSAQQGPAAPTAASAPSQGRQGADAQFGTPAPYGATAGARGDMRSDASTLLAAETRDYGVAAPSQPNPQLHGPTPTTIPGGQLITTDRLLALYQQAQHNGLLVFHVLGPGFALPMAQNAVGAAQPGDFSDAVQRQFGQYLQQVTQGNKSRPMVFYCLNTQCWMSWNAALRAIRMGYSQVYWYRGGVEAWQQAQQMAADNAGSYEVASAGREPPQQQTRSQPQPQPKARPQSQPQAAPQQRAQPGQADAAPAPVRMPQPTEASVPALDTSRLVEARIVDQNGFGRPMTAMHLQIPAGWQTVGGVAWNQDQVCHTLQRQIHWAAIAPDSLSAIELLPAITWQMADTSAMTRTPCPRGHYKSALDFLQQQAQQLRADARVLDYQDMPALAQELRRKGDEEARSKGLPVTPGVRTETGRILVAYQQDGISMREVMTATVSFYGVVATAERIAALRAPADRLDPVLLERVLTTLRPDPEWDGLAFRRIKGRLDQFYARQSQQIRDHYAAESRQIDAWHQRQMSIINQRGMADRHAIRMRGNAEVANIYGAIAASNSASSDRMHRRNLEAIGEYNTFAGTGGTTVQSSIHGGSRVFQSTTDPGQAYSTDAPYASPPPGFTELQRVR